MQQIIECVPNFSEGSRPEIYGAIADAIRTVPGTYVLDVSADPDHNRTVITFAGPPSAVEEAAFQAIKQAAQLINLDEHSGEHPRLGATDVVPLIPIKGVTIEACVQLAHRLGKRVGEELGIAVYLYGHAATRPERTQLADIRKGEYERWREEIGVRPARQPDYGPAEARPWGATVIGVRPFLIAYNIFLNSSDVEVAKKIARSIRGSSGGLQNVQALGFLVNGQAQVSMNLLDFNQTPIHRVQELVRREAARYGLYITKAELVGLTPQKALIDAAKWYLQLDETEDEQILEYRMAKQEEGQGALATLVPLGFLDAVARGTATPGGGAVAALAGALGAALAQMTAGLTAGRQKYADAHDEAVRVLTEAGELRAELTRAVTEDAAAFEKLMAAFRNKEVLAEERQAAVEAATVGTGEVPLHVMRLCRDVARLARDIARVGNVNAVTDAAAGGIMARSASQIAAINIRVNAVGLQDQQLAQAWRDSAAAILEETESLVAELIKIATERGGF